MNANAIDQFSEATGVVSPILRNVSLHPAKEARRLEYVLANDVGQFTAIDELVEGVLTAGAGSVVYGDSNSGKTFFVIDLCCAVARGTKWMGRHTEPGMVIYLASEAPASIRMRLLAYQQHHAVSIDNLAIVQSPINLHDTDADTDALIDLIGELEATHGKKAVLIVGDTLARLSAGANENSGQDMGLVISRFDRIREECKVHFCLVHHSGKNAANGMRGWSGIRGAIDTEIEVTVGPSGHCAEITKQRDLGTKGQRLGFRLDVVHLGRTKWGSAVASCIVLPSEAQPRKAATRISEAGGAILEFLSGNKLALSKKQIVLHFKGRYHSTNIYRQIKDLVAAGKLIETNDTFAVPAI